MQTLGDLPLLRTAVDARTSVGSAVALLSETPHEPLAVTAGGRFVGTVLFEAAAVQRPDQPVGEGTPYLGPKFEAGQSAREAAAEFVRHRLAYAPVYQGEEFVGLVTARMLLTELGRSWDPMTGLSWSDRLREWGAAALASGNEVSIVFFDVDSFGQYNKRHGHVAGDRVLRAVSDRLSQLVQGDDVLVRYGGDEFVWGTTRPRVIVEEAASEALAQPIRAEGVPEEVRVSHGVSGGKRTKEREATHYAATLDNLINLASRACLASKSSAEPAAEVEFVALDEKDPRVPTAVQLRSGGRSATGFDRRESGAALASVGRATSEALSRLGLGTVSPVRTRAEVDVDGRVWVTVEGRAPDGTTREARRRVEADLYHSAAEAWVRLLGGPSSGAGPA